VQVCGLWPFTTAAGTPLAGAPLGPNLKTGAMVCFDPITWFRLGILSNPSQFVFSLNGRGKSTLVRHQLVIVDAFGNIPLVLGDLKPDYVLLIRQLGGQVIECGPGRGGLNILDQKEAADAATRLEAAGHIKLANQVRADSQARRASMVSALISIARNDTLTDQEDTMIERAIGVLDEKHPGTPELSDLLAVVTQGPQELREVALDDGDETVYRQVTRGLRASLTSLVTGGRLGTMFSTPASQQMRRDQPVVFDVSSIPEARSDMAAAALLACWSTGFGVVNAAHALADAGLEPERHYWIVMDEMWRALRAGHGMVDRLDALTRLNRTTGTGHTFITHSISDLLALPDEADRLNARGMIERAGAVIMGALPASEMELLTQTVKLTQAEQAELISWSGQETWGRTQTRSVVPGRGQFMIKIGGRPGIPFMLQLTPEELEANDTNQRWHQASRIGRVEAT